MFVPVCLDLIMTTSVNNDVSCSASRCLQSLLACEQGAYSVFALLGVPTSFIERFLARLHMCHDEVGDCSLRLSSLKLAQLFVSFLGSQHRAAFTLCHDCCIVFAGPPHSDA